MLSFGEYIKKIRQEDECSIKDAAESCFISKHIMSKLEAGLIDPDYMRIDAFCERFPKASKATMKRLALLYKAHAFVQLFPTEEAREAAELLAFHAKDLPKGFWGYLKRTLQEFSTIEVPEDK